LKCTELIRKLERAGWYTQRQSGSHMVMVHASKDFKIIVPNHGTKEVGKGLERKLLKLTGIK
jgi:mRNA interferase HicA